VPIGPPMGRDCAEPQNERPAAAPLPRVGHRLGRDLDLDVVERGTERGNGDVAPGGVETTIVVGLLPRRVRSTPSTTSPKTTPTRGPSPSAAVAVTPTGA
jgi:hypothetical protein